MTDFSDDTGANPFASAEPGTETDVQPTPGPTDSADAPPAGNGAGAGAGAGADPRGYPAKFVDPQTGALRADALARSYVELERKLSGMVALPGENAGPDDLARFHKATGVPDGPEGYEIETRHPFVEVDTAVNQRLHEAGFTPAQAQLVYDLAAEHLLPAVERLTAEVATGNGERDLAGHFGGDDRWRIAARQIGDWAEANLPGEVHQALAASPAGVLAMERLMRSGEPALVSGGGGALTEASESELGRLMEDPKYWRDHDPETVARVEQGFRRLYPGGPAA